MNVPTIQAQVGSEALVQLLLEDKTILSCCRAGFADESLGTRKIQNKLCDLLNICAEDLRKDELLDNNERHIVSSFVIGSSRMASQELCYLLLDENVDMTHLTRLADHAELIKKLSMAFRGKTSSLLIQSEAGEDVNKQPNKSPPDLNRLRRFLVPSTAYQSFCQAFFRFVNLQFYSRVIALVAQFARPDHPHDCPHHQYDWPRVVSDMRCMIPHSVRAGSGHPGGLTNSVKGIMESWTRTKWDWWPLMPYMRPVCKFEQRISWTRVCGGSTSIEVPAPFANELERCTAKYMKDEKRTPLVQQALAPGRNTAPGQSVTCISPNKTPTQPSNVGSGPDAPATPAQINPPAVLIPQSSNIHTSSVLKMNRYILLVVKKGSRRFLSQIQVHDLDNNAFFQSLRSEYYRLRGRWRNLLSVWRYSHCDFYQFEKFEDSEYAPRVKDDFPTPQDTTYEYEPRPMDVIPSISEHEFYARFYTCYRPNAWSAHCFHTCKRASGYCCDALGLLPKKKTRLESNGDKREKFWGIYAQEVICFRWVLGYNLGCMLPLVVFFFLWEFGFQGDLQNAGTPLTLVVSMLAVFWTIFHFQRDTVLHAI
ncbi:hypothetical protein BJX99DRAFT_265289 [Aspergillus californicus]